MHISQANKMMTWYKDILLAMIAAVFISSSTQSINCPSNGIISQSFLQQFAANDSLSFVNCNPPVIKIDDYTFQEYVHLKHLLIAGAEECDTHMDCSNYRLEELKTPMFDGLYNLEYLQIKYANIYEIKDHTFQDLLNLKELDLSRNKIQRLSRSIFSYFVNLEKLDLYSNNLGVIPADTFELLGNLYILDFSYNERIKDDLLDLKKALTPLTNLKDLKLEGNKIEEFPDGFFDIMLESLEKLDISWNYIKVIPGSYFGMIRYLNHLDISGNPLGNSLYSAAFSGLPNIESVNANNIGMSVFDINTFEDLISVNVTISLRFNNIQTLSPDIEDVYRINQESDVRFHFHLENNPFHCNCELLWLKHWYENEPGAAGLLRIPTCQTPFKASVSQSSVDQFTCKSPSVPQITTKYDMGIHKTVITCESSGDPAPVIQWTTPMDKDAGVSVPDMFNKSIRTNTAELYFEGELSAYSNTFCSGNYTCTASNPAGLKTVVYMPATKKVVHIYANTSLIVGVALGVFLMAAIITIVVLLIKLRKKQQGQVTKSGK